MSEAFFVLDSPLPRVPFDEISYPRLRSCHFCGALAERCADCGAFLCEDCIDVRIHGPHGVEDHRMHATWP